jgi:PAS domain S-box-containing protein
MDSKLDKTFDFASTEISFRDVLEYAPIGILIFNNEFQVKYVNRNFFHFGGVTAGDYKLIIGKSVYEYRLFESIDLRKDLNELRDGFAFEKELIASHTLSGNKISIVIKCVPILLEGKFNGGVIVVEDVKISSSHADAVIVYSPNFQNFLSLICDSFFFVDIEGNIKIASSGFEDFKFLFEPDISDSTQRPQKLSGILFKKLLETVVIRNKTVGTDIPFIKDNSERRVNITLIPIAENENKVETIIALVKSIEPDKDTIQYNNEEIIELRRYQQIVANVLDGVIGLNKEGKIVFWNESSSKLFGLTRSEVYGKFIGKIFQKIDLPFFEQIINEVNEKNYWQGEFKIGEEESIAEYYAVNIGVIQEDSEKIYFMLCSNITQKARIEKELHQSEEKFRNIVINSHEYICILSLSGKINYANPMFLETFQYTEEELLRINFTELVDEFYLQEKKYDLNDLTSLNVRSLEIPLINKSGQRIFVLASFSAARDSDDNPLYYNVILTDITQKKESEKDLLLIRSLFEASHDGIALINKKKFVLVNDSFVRMFSYRSASEIIGQDPLDFLHKDDLPKVDKYLNLLEEGGDAPARYEFKGKKRNNSIFELENSVSTYDAHGEKFIVWVLRDITEEKKSKLALQISEERYRSISENIYESFWTAEKIDNELKAVFYTPAIKKITGYNVDEFLGDSNLWKKIIYPDDIDAVDTGMQNLYNDSARNFEAFEYRIIDALGNIIWIENKLSIKRDSNGEIQKVYGVISDISLSRRAEVELQKSADELKELNEAKDRFISIISHDLRTPFSSILGFTDFLLNDKDITEDKREQYVRYIQESAKSMLSLVNSLLDWTRLQTGRIAFEPQRINAKFVIDKSIQVLSGAALQKKISLLSNLQKDLFIHADESLLFQVFNNLISNAIKFTRSGKKIIVDASVNIDERIVQFSVLDEGIGIKKENIEKLFKVDSKFTTPGTSGEKGSGLGLSLVNDIIKKHGGKIWVESEYGSGSKFIFTIPVASTNILLVDDIKTDRLLYSKLIKNLMPNYSILEAQNGKEALDIIKNSSPALVITDHKMPLMSGYDLVKQLNITDLKYRPPVIILTSDYNAAIESEYKELGIEFIFQKPVNLSNFKNAIEKSLRKAIFS